MDFCRASLCQSDIRVWHLHIKRQCFCSIDHADVVLHPLCKPNLVARRYKSKHLGNSTFLHISTVRPVGVLWRHAVFNKRFSGNVKDAYCVCKLLVEDQLAVVNLCPVRSASGGLYQPSRVAINWRVRIRGDVPCERFTLRIKLEKWAARCVGHPYVVAAVNWQPYRGAKCRRQVKDIWELRRRRICHLWWGDKLQEFIIVKFYQCAALF